MNQTVLRKHDLNKFRAMLEARIADLERSVSRRDGIAVEATADTVDQIQRASELALAVSYIDRESKQLQNARAALRRIHDGVFGVCGECDEEISLKRLLAIPWASLCVVCQESLDRRVTDVAFVPIEQPHAA
jgi:DnaK suppressor protein